MFKGICCIITLVGLLVFAGISRAQESNKGQNEVGFSDLTFKIKTDKKENLLLEPMTIQMELANNHEKEIVGSVRMNFFQGYVSLIVYHQDTRREFKSLSYMQLTDCGVYVKPPTFQPKSSVEERQILTYKLEEIFPEPGEYQIQLVLDNRYAASAAATEQQIVSEKLNVRILQPEGREFAAYSSYSDADIQDFIQHKIEYSDKDKHRAGFEKAVAFMDSFGDSVYGKWVKNFFLEYYDIRKTTPLMSEEEKSLYERLKAAP